VNDHPGPAAPPAEGEQKDGETPAVVEQPANPWGQNARKAGAAAGGLALLLLKFKTFLAFLLEFKFLAFGLKFLASSWTLLLSLWLYALAFGWRFGLVLVGILVVHEFGHYAAFRAYGLAVRVPVFVPFLGAFTAGALPDDLEEDANIALAGPLSGLVLAGLCYGAGIAWSDPFWYACAYAAAFLNLFNMIPTPPFDGGRIIGALWPPLWLGGFALFIALSFVLHIPLFFVLLIGLLGVPAMWKAWKGDVDPRAAAMSNGARLRVSLSYLGTLGALAAIAGLSLAASHGAPARAW
jgi:Zn-dependent protease